jgi:cysteinyl-tRNA synthetase
MAVLLDLVSTTNTYAQKVGRTNISLEAVEEVAHWVTRMLRMFGLGEGEAKSIGWGEKRTEGEGGGDVRLCILLSIFPMLLIRTHN